MTLKLDIQIVVIRIFLNERDALYLYTDTPFNLIRKIDVSITKAQLKRATIKRVAVAYTVKELNTIISKIALTVNQRNNLGGAQYTLSSLFGRLATQYNLAISS